MDNNFSFSASQTQQQQQDQHHHATMFTSLFHQSQQQRQANPVVSRPQPSSSDTATPMLIDDTQVVEEQEQQENDDQTRRETEKRIPFSSLSKEKVDSSDAGKSKTELKEPNLDGLCCPICMDPWGSQGDHQVSCLPCGHVYGLSCISRWLQRHLISGKCPQCNAKCTLKDVRKLYASPIAVNDEDLKKKVQSLEAEIGSLKTERADLLVVQDNLLKIQDNLFKELHNLKKKQTCTGNMPFVEMGSKLFGFSNAKEARSGQFDFSTNFGRQKLLHCTFMLEHELAVEGARLFDMDVSYENLILARRISGMGGIHMLNKINLINPYENEDIQLPPSTKAVKDLQISPCGRFILLASLGKKLSVLSMGSNEVITTYDLRVPAWSCSWDLNSPNYMYAGLQNGMLLVFDMRHTINPLQSMVGLTPRPIHTIHSMVHNPAFGHNAKKLLIASSFGPCTWNTDAGDRPIPIPGLDNQGICTSLAYGPLSDDIVASYRPKVHPPTSTVNSQSLYQESSTVPGRGILGSQVLVKRVAGDFYHNLGSTSAHLSDFQMAKSAIVNMENCFPLLVYADGVTHGLRLRELPSLTVNQNLKPHHCPILDVRYACAQRTGVLGCVSDNKLQLFSAKVS